MTAFRIIALAALLAVASAQVEVDTDEFDFTNSTTNPYVLKAGLYPWIPQPSAGDPTFSVMLAWIESTFEAANPGIDLQLMPMQSPDYDFYDLPSLLKWLTSPLNSADGWAIVEPDYSFYGSLIAANALAPFSGPDSQWDLPNMFPVGRKFYNIKKGYTVPHWLCSEFVLSRSAAIQNAPTVGALANALKNAVDQNAPAGAKNTVPVVYDLFGTWATPTFYLLGVQETFGRQAVENAIATPLPPVSNAVAQGSTKRLVEACAPRGSDPADLSVNPCWNGDYYNSDPRALADLLASGQAVAAMGYSETMHDVMQSTQLVDKAQLRIRAVPNGLFGNPESPLAFSDGFVLNKFCTSNACQSAAKKFVKFMNSDAVFKYIMTGADTQAPYRRVNRYLSAGMKSPYKFVKDDPVYMAVGKTYDDDDMATWPFSKNLIDNRLALYAAVRANIDPATYPNARNVKFPDPHSRKFFARP